jgi:hypothetical protein
MAAPLLKENSILVSDFWSEMVDKEEILRRKLPPPLWWQLSLPKKFEYLVRVFHKWKGKRHRPGMPRTASTEGDF